LYPSVSFFVVVLVHMKEARDLLLQHRNLTWFDVDKAMLKKLALNMGRQIVPPQEHRRPEVLKDTRLLLGQRHPRIATVSLYRSKGAAFGFPPGEGARFRAACSPALLFLGCHVPSILLQ